MLKVTLKLATSLDGCIATSTGESQWITCAESRALVHVMRADHDALLTGIGTVLADDPLLTARTSGSVSHQSSRIILDTHLRTPVDARLFSTTQSKVIIFAGTSADTDKESSLKKAGADVHRISYGSDGRLDLVSMLEVLQTLGTSSLMIEGGGEVAASFLKAGLVSNLFWFRAPIIIGGDGVPVFSTLGVKMLSDGLHFSRQSVRTSGDDLLEVYEKIG